MAIDDLYQALVEYHGTRNLDRCKGNMKNGAVTTSRWPEGVPEGKEVDLYDGHTFVCNGAKRLETLVKDGWTTQKEVEGWHSLRSKQDLFLWLDDHDARDGAVVFDSDNQRITMVYKMYDTPRCTPFTQLKNAFLTIAGKYLDKNSSDDDDLAHYVPPNFVHAESTQSPTPDQYGTNSRLSHRLSKMYPGARVIQIKKSAFGKVRMGKVISWENGYLSSEFYLDSESNGSAPKFIGIEKKYRFVDGKMMIDSEHRYSLDKENIGPSQTVKPLYKEMSQAP